MATRHLQKHFWLILCLPPCSHTHRDTQTHTHTTHNTHTTPPRPNTNTNTKHNTPHTHTTPHTRQPTVILRVFVNARISTCQATDRDLESVFVKRKVNAWICACHSTDRDLETKKWMLGYVPSAFFNLNCNVCNACNVCNFDADLLFSI